jgi:hypothetical protein
VSNLSYVSDGNEIQISDGKTLYMSVVMSENRRRVGMRLEQCRSWGKPTIVWVDTKALPQLVPALTEMLARLA